MPIALASDVRACAEPSGRGESSGSSARCSNQRKEAYMIMRMLVARSLRRGGYPSPDCKEASRTMAARISKPESIIDIFVVLDSDDRRDGPRIVSSITPIISRLKRLLPNTVPVARSGESVSVTALIPVKISGSDVAVASMTAPRKPLLSPV